MVSSEEIGSADVDALRSSPIHGVSPISEDSVEIEIAQIEIDPTNPGSLTDSLRYQRRNPSIRDSWDILGRIVYPIVVCQQSSGPYKFMHVDGFGRLEQVKARGATKIRAIIYPPLDLEQRICLRETLNAAQEPFDAASVVRDLQELAKARGLDVRNKEHIKTLVRDMPDKVRRREQDLVVLARFAPEAAARIGESYKGEDGAIGLDKVKALARVLDVMSKRHTDVTSLLGGDMALSTKLTQMYVDGKFRKGRSQQALREVARALDTLPENDPHVREFFRKEQDWQVLQPFAEKAQPADLVKLCEQLASVLISLDTTSLSVAERRALNRTQTVLNQVLGD